MQANAALTNATKLLPWEEGSISKQDTEKLGMFREPIQKLLHRDPCMRASVRQFNEDVNKLFSDNPQADVAQIAGPSGRAVADDCSESHRTQRKDADTRFRMAGSL